MKNYFYFFVITSFVAFSVGCSCSGGKNRTDSQWTTDMAKQNPIKAQEGSEEGKMLMRMTPEGTRARNRRYYPYTGDPLSAEKNLKNPLERSREVLARGQTYYNRYCIYCHGSTGDSVKEASVASKMIIQPPSLLTDKAKNYTEGRLYHIIYEGQGLMGVYRIQLETEEQVVLSHYVQGENDQKYKGSESVWSVVHYIRALQENSN